MFLSGRWPCTPTLAVFAGNGCQDNTNRLCVWWQNVPARRLGHLCPPGQERPLWRAQPSGSVAHARPGDLVMASPPGGQAGPGSLAALTCCGLAPFRCCLSLPGVTWWTTFNLRSSGSGDQGAFARAARTPSIDGPRPTVAHLPRRHLALRAHLNPRLCFLYRGGA